METTSTKVKEVPAMRTSKTKTVIANAPFVELAIDERGHWHWQAWSSNGRAMAQSGSGYERKKDAVQAVKFFIASVPAMKYIVQSHSDDATALAEAPAAAS